MLTIENDAHLFWDWDAIFPGKTVAEDFKAAGATVEYIDNGEMEVRGLDLKKAMEIASKWNADYLGPVLGDAHTNNPINITPLRLAR